MKNDGTHHLKTTDDTLIYNNPFFAPVINAVSDQANKLDYYVIISIVYSKEDLKKVESIFNQKMIEGAIFVGTQEDENEFIFKLIKQGYKIAMIDTSEVYSKEHNAIYINPDNYEGSAKAVNHLVELGHKKIGIITGNLNKVSAKERLDGFKETLSYHGLKLSEDHIFQGDFTEDSGYEGIKSILNGSNKPTAILSVTTQWLLELTKPLQS